MVGILVQLLISWALVWLVEKKDLSVLGLKPQRDRFRNFLIYFLIAAFFCASGFFLRMYLAKQSWIINPEITISAFLEAIWWNIKSVIFEELIFRGVLLYLIIRRWGAVVGVALSAIGFGIYHWFSFEVFGKIPQMVTTFLITGAMGVVYAYAYAKSRSIYIPSAIHLGWNLTTSVVFSETVIGNQLLVRVQPDPVVTISYAAWYFMQFFPLVGVILVNFILLKKMKQVSE